MAIDVRRLWAGWKPKRWELRRWWCIAVFLVAAFVGGLWMLVQSQTHSDTWAGAFLLAAVALGTVFLLSLYPGRGYGRPALARVDHRAGPYDAVVFGVRRGIFWFAAFQYVAVTPDALVLGYLETRVHLPWDDIAEARPVAEESLVPMGYNWMDRWKVTRSIALIRRAGAVADPEFAAMLRRFGRVGFLSRELGHVPMIDVDRLAAPYALLRAVRWHLARPHTPETLMEGYENGWPEEPARVE